MQITEKLNLTKPESTDDILDTIARLYQNFEVLDNVYEQKTLDLQSFLVEGKVYNAGDKLWNALPKTGSPVGWVNIRTGKHAPKWLSNTRFTVGDFVIDPSNNGHVYKCVSDGLSAISQPTFLTSTSSTFYDVGASTVWSSSNAYQLNDIVIASNGDKSYYFKCITAGTSSTVEPSWVFTDGTTIVDGTVVWLVCKSAQWKEDGNSSYFLPFGEVKVNNTYTHSQTTSSTTWDITHNMNKYPHISIFDDTNDLVFGNIEYISLNEVRITFSKTIKGMCYLN